MEGGYNWSFYCNKVIDARAKAADAIADPARAQERLDTWSKIMADIMDGKPAANPWADFDWPAIPGHFGPTWFLPFVGAYYKLQDILH